MKSPTFSSLLTINFLWGRRADGGRLRGSPEEWWRSSGQTFRWATTKPSHSRHTFFFPFLYRNRRRWIHLKGRPWTAGTFRLWRRKLLILIRPFSCGFQAALPIYGASGCVWTAASPLYKPASFSGERIPPCGSGEVLSTLSLVVFTLDISLYIFTSHIFFFAPLWLQALYNFFFPFKYIYIFKHLCLFPNKCKGKNEANWLEVGGKCSWSRWYLVLFQTNFCIFFFIFWSLSNLPTTTWPLAAADFWPGVHRESKTLRYKCWSVHPAAYLSESAAQTLEHVCWVDCFSRSSVCGWFRSLLCSQRLCLYVCLVVSHCGFEAEIHKKSGIKDELRKGTLCLARI